MNETEKTPFVNRSRCNVCAIWEMRNEIFHLYRLLALAKTIAKLRQRQGTFFFVLRFSSLDNQLNQCNCDATVFISPVECRTNIFIWHGIFSVGEMNNLKTLVSRLSHGSSSLWLNQRKLAACGWTENYLIWLNRSFHLSSSMWWRFIRHIKTFGRDIRFLPSFPCFFSASLA